MNKIIKKYLWIALFLYIFIILSSFAVNIVASRESGNAFSCGGFDVFYDCGFFGLLLNSIIFQPILVIIMSFGYFLNPFTLINNLFLNNWSLIDKIMIPAMFSMILFLWSIPITTFIIVLNK